MANGDSSAEETRPAQPRRLGRFQLQEQINAGGMAEIWLVTDEEGKTYAMKLLHEKFGIFDLTTRKRFTTGCEILSKIHGHKLVIGYVEHGKIDGRLYLLMEYVEASNLKLLFARQDPVLFENVANILIDAAEALDHVHQSGYMHLDFKPENLLITRNADLRLVDFDLALPKPEKPQKQSKYPGTPYYMAPEQLQRAEIDHRADIFAFGVMAYELLAYQKPFDGETAEEVLRKQLAGEMPRLLELNPELPPSLEGIVLKCLALDPEQRYPYMSVVVRDLQKVLYVA